MEQEETSGAEVRLCAQPGFAEGPETARLVLVGEAWGREEAWHKRPFVGASGQLLNKWLWKLGLRRHEVYVTNVVCDKPINNDIKKIPKAELIEWERQLHDRLKDLQDPKIIVPLGATALSALLRVRGASITNLRGSVLGYTDKRDRTVPMLPLLHPAAVLRSPDLQARTDLDLAKIKALLDGTQQAPEPIEVAIVHDPDNIPVILEPETYVALDIETIPDKGVVTSLAVATHKNGALVFPLQEWSMPDVQRMMNRLGVWLKDSSLILQNGFYDLTWLKAKFNLDLIDNYRWDTRWMHHALTPKDEHSLAYLASVYTNRPYWKDMRKAKGPFALYEYNGIDAAVTFEIWGKLFAALTNNGRMDFYHEHYRKLYKPLFEIMRHGIRVDEPRRKILVDEYTTRAKAADEQMTAIVGYPLIAKTAISTAKLAKYLYEDAKPKMPKRMKLGKVTTEEAALIDLRTKYPDKNPDASKVIDLVLEHRRVSKLTSTFLKDNIADADGRARCEYSFTPITGRLSSSSNPLGTGLNLQNIDAEVRDVFVPDKGCVFLEVDLSQAEWRVMAMLTRDSKLRELARTKPTEFDIHRYNAGIIFGVSEADVTPDQRYLGKRAAHAADYGMQAAKLSEILLKDGHPTSVSKCETIIDTYMDRMPPIRVWQAETAAMVRNHRALANTWGRIVHFNDERLTDEAYRQAYAWVPQSEVGDLLNHYGLKPVWCRYRRKTNLQEHDALYLSVKPVEAYAVAKYMTICLERPRTYYGHDLVIPCTYKLNWNWKEGTEYKVLPSEREFTAAAHDAAAKVVSV